MAETNQLSTTFAQFFNNWEEQHKSYLEKLEKLSAHNQHKTCSASATDDDDSGENPEIESLIQQVLRHYQDYYDEKSKAADTDVFLMFSPPWFSRYERTLLWVTGFKPSVMFKLVKESVGGELNEQQNERIAEVREQTGRMEREIDRAMAGVQESVAAPGLCGLMKREHGLVDGEVSDMENAVGELKAAMLGVMRDADDLRQQTGLRVLEVLNTGQKVRFMAGTSRFWLQIRRLGMERDNRRQRIQQHSHS